MIEVKNVSKVFKGELFDKPFQALDNLSFSLGSQRIVGFLGANGSGKTTLIKIVMGFISATKGKIKYHHNLGKNSHQVLRNIGYMPERPYFYPSLTTRELIHYIGLLNDISKLELNKRINELAERLKIDHAVDRKLQGYSKGMLQRAGFLMNICLKPKFYILDEPLSGLDPIGRKEFKDIIKELKSSGATIFFSSHIVADIEDISDDIVLIEKGKLVYEGSMKKMYELDQDDTLSILFEQEGEMQSISSVRDDLDKNLAKIKELGGQLFEIRKNQKSLEEIVYKMRD